MPHNCFGSESTHAKDINCYCSHTHTHTTDTVVWPIRAEHWAYWGSQFVVAEQSIVFQQQQLPRFIGKVRKSHLLTFFYVLIVFVLNTVRTFSSFSYNEKTSNEIKLWRDDDDFPDVFPANQPTKFNALYQYSYLGYSNTVMSISPHVSSSPTYKFVPASLDRPYNTMILSAAPVERVFSVFQYSNFASMFFTEQLILRRCVTKNGNLVSVNWAPNCFFH